MPLTDEQDGQVLLHMSKAARIIAKECYDELKHLDIRDGAKVSDALGDECPINQVSIHFKVLCEVMYLKAKECKQLELF